MINKILKTKVRKKELYSCTIELLTQCNWKCKHCYIPCHENSGLNTNEIFRILEEIRCLGVFELVLTGGEIFLRKDIMLIIKKARELFFNVKLLSNISLLTEEKIKQLAQLDIAEISCTIFSMNDNIHDNITGVEGSLKRSINNLTILKKYNIPIVVKTVLMKENFDDYKEVERFCIDNGFKYVSTPIITLKYDGDTSPKDLRLTDKQLEKYFKYTEKNNMYDENVNRNDTYLCSTIRYSLAITANGDVIPCNAFNYIVGNIKNNSIKSIWEDSEELHSLQDTVWENVVECNNCKNKKFCYKCPGITLVEEKDYLKKSSLACQHAKVRYKLFYMKGGEKYEEI